jgi:hypothetical protein
VSNTKFQPEREWNPGDSPILPPVPNSAYPPDAIELPVSLNTDPPQVRCTMCGSRCRWAGFWMECRHCSWASHDHRRVGWLWRLRVLVGR